MENGKHFPRNDRQLVLKISKGLPRWKKIINLRLKYDDLSLPYLLIPPPAHSSSLFFREIFR